ncbi:acid protease [Cantharellus anzutake]|uniref:acid protease n=1 Tax=Cantharellus anzutake TaxID=1750568 RepID=UPI0019046079|nr:acid protease [Cantharellus anzutake]KAF8327281.1 acid protease [Cantharellus anzutake]
MKFTTPFIVASLPFMALASPTAKGFSIPVTKRGSSFTQDGVVNMRALRAHLRHVATKYGAGHVKNTGSVHPATPNGVAHTSKRKTGVEALADVGQQGWYGNVSIGSPPVIFTTVFDTGSSDLFIPDISCENCGQHTRYNSSSSSTSRDVGKSFNVTYAGGASSSGQLYTDDVTVAGLKAKDQTLGSATNYAPVFQTASTDGLLGLARPLLSRYNATPFFNTLIQQGCVRRSVFAFHLSECGSSLRLGGTDESIYKPPLTFNNVTSQLYWQVNLDGVNVGRNRAVSGLSAIIDSGTTVIAGDPDTVGQFYQAINGSAIFNTTDGFTFYSYPCSQDPQVSFTLNNVSYSIASQYFNLGQVSEGSSHCLGCIAALADFPVWILGDRFMMNVYTGERSFHPPPDDIS